MGGGAAPVKLTRMTPPESSKLNVVEAMTAVSACIVVRPLTFPCMRMAKTCRRDSSSASASLRPVSRATQRRNSISCRFSRSRSGVKA